MTLLSIGLFVAIYVVLTWGLMSLAHRFLHRWAGLVIGILAVALLVFWTVHALIICSAEPVFLPPEPGQAGEGLALHPCDGPGGMMIYGFIFFVAPLCLLLCGTLLWRFWKRPMPGKTRL